MGESVETPYRSPFSPALLIVSALLAFSIYIGNVRRPLSAPDLEFVSDSPAAAASMSAGQIWGASFPPERPDLGMYRPIQAEALKLQYRQFPGSIGALRATNLALFVLIVLAFNLLAFRLFDSGAARWAAVLGVTLHPMAAEALNLVSAQGTLIAALAWVLALLVYRRALAGGTRLGLASPAVAALYFIAGGAHEAGLLLPFALLALDRLQDTPADASSEARKRDAARAEKKNRKKGKKKGRAEDEAEEETANDATAPVDPPTGAARLSAFGFPLAVVAMALLGLRWIALDGLLGARPVLRDAVSPLPALFARLLAPLSSFSFSPNRYGASLLPGSGGWMLPAESALGIVVVAGICAGFVAARGGVKRLWLLGLALALLPALPLWQIAPLSKAYSERLLTLALPGWGILLGACATALLPNEGARSINAARRGRMILGSFAALFAVHFAATLWQNSLWRRPEDRWAAQAAAAPGHPGPLVYQIIERINARNRAKEPFTQETLDWIDAKSTKTLELAKPPDADPVYQYQTLLRLQLAAPRDVKRWAEKALAAPGPHSAGYFASIGTAAFQGGLIETAEAAMQRELQRKPDDFDALYILAAIDLGRRKLDTGVAFAEKAAKVAPPRLRAQASMRVGIIAARMAEAEDQHAAQARAGKDAAAKKKSDEARAKAAEARQKAALALKKAIDLDPALGEAYVALARMLIDTREYDGVERILVAARSKAAASFTSYVSLYSVQVDSFERQIKEATKPEDRQRLQARAVDLLTEMTRTYPWDLPLQLYAGNYYLDHGSFEKAREQYQKVLAGTPRQPEALYGLARLADEVDHSRHASAIYLKMSLGTYPDNAAALKLYEKVLGKKFDVKDLKEPPPDDAPGSGGSPSTATGPAIPPIPPLAPANP